MSPGLKMVIKDCIRKTYRDLIFKMNLKNYILRETYAYLSYMLFTVLWQHFLISRHHSSLDIGLPPILWIWLSISLPALSWVQFNTPFRLAKRSLPWLHVKARLKRMRVKGSANERVFVLPPLSWTFIHHKLSPRYEQVRPAGAAGVLGGVPLNHYGLEDHAPQLQSCSCKIVCFI